MYLIEGGIIFISIFRMNFHIYLNTQLNKLYYLGLSMT